MIAKEFEIKVLLNKKTKDAKNNILHKDVKLPQVAQNEGINGEKGEFFQLSLLTTKEKTASGKKKDTLGKAVIFNLWDTGNRMLLFQSIKEELANTKFELDSEGNALLTDYGCDGSNVKRDCPNHFLWDAIKNETLKDQSGSPIIRDFIQMFIFDHEENDGTIDVLFASEKRRRLQHPVVAQPSEKQITVE